MLSHKVYTAENYKENSLKKWENENQKKRENAHFKMFQGVDTLFYEKIN